MLRKHWWRALQLLTPTIVLAWFWVVIPHPTTIQHTQGWIDAKAKQAAHQYDECTPEGLAAVRALMASAEAMVSDQVAVIQATPDPYQRLVLMSEAEVRLARMLSKHPMWPGPLSPWLDQGLREAAGLGGGAAMDGEMVRLAQANTPLLTAAHNEQERLMREYGIGYTEPLSLTAPYYLSWTLYWLALLILVGLTGALVLGFKLASFGYGWREVSQREFGSIWVGLAIAPVANLLLFDAYETPNRDNRDYRLVTDPNRTIAIGDAMRLSFGFRAAVVATIAAIITNLFHGAGIAYANDGPPVVVQTTTYVELEDENAPVNNEVRLVVPMDGGNAFQCDYNLNSDMFAMGVRGRTRTLTGRTKVQPRLSAVFQKEHFALKLQAVTLGQGWSLFSSLKLPEAQRASLYNELAVDVGQFGDVQLQAVLIESGGINRQADWQAGPLLNIAIGEGTLSLLAGFGLGGGGPGDQLRVQYSIPLN